MQYTTNPPHRAGKPWLPGAVRWLVLLLLGMGLNGYSQNITQAEYTLDTEAVPGMGIPITGFTAAPNVPAMTFQVPMSGLTTGLHILSIRTRDANQVWSLTNRRVFYYTPVPTNIVQAEYTLDTEAVPGSGIPITIPAPASTDISALSFVVSALNGLATGVHVLSIRTRDANGWSLTNRRTFFYDPGIAIATDVTRVESYFDTDPGFGLGTPALAFMQAPNVPVVTLLADATLLADGPHRVFVRSRDANGKWSLVSNRPFVKNGCGSSLNLAFGLPTVNYYTNGGGNPSQGFDDPVPMGANLPSIGTTSYLQVDLGAARTVNAVRATFLCGTTGTLNLQVRTAATAGGSYSSVTTQSIAVTANVLTTRLLPFSSTTSVGAVRLAVINAPGGSVTVSNAGVYYFNCSPNITTASIGGTNVTGATIGSTITLNGSNFTGATSVTIGGVVVPITPAMVNAAGTQITVVVPPGATMGTIVINVSPNGPSNTIPFNIVPAITSLSPTSGAVGSNVTLTGTGFSGVTGITINGVPATIVGTPTSTGITIRVPAGATTGPVVVTTAGGSSASTGVTFTVILPPTLTSISPTSGVVGATITLTGTNFSAGSTVSFNGVAGTNVAVVNATTITVTVPNGATTGPVQVTTPGGQTAGVSFTVISRPSLTSITPNSGPLGTTGVVIAGSNLTGATSITFTGPSGNIVTTGFVVNAAGTQITNIIVPAGATTGLVTVTTPGGVSTGNVTFTVLPRPTIAGLSPATGPVGTVVTITGTNFSTSSTVSFNGVAGTNVTVVNATTITVNVPAGATTGNVTVTSAGVTSTNTAGFTVTAPQLAVLQGTTGYANGATYSFGSRLVGSSTSVAFTLRNAGTAPLTITGNAASPGVFVATPAAPFTVPAGGTFTVTVTFTPTASGLQTGAWQLVSSLGTYTVNLNGTGTVPAPVLTSLSPTSGTAGTTPVTVTGTNLGGATLVTFGGQTVTFTNNTATGLTFTVPTGLAPGPYAVVVTTPGGPSNSLPFTVTAPLLPQLSVSQGATTYLNNGAAYPFGNQNVGTTSASVVFTLTNIGMAPLTITGITPTGDYARSAAPTLPLTLAAGSSVTVNVTFTPTAPGVRVGTLAIASNAGTAYTVNLTGNGIAPVPSIGGLSTPSGAVGSTVTITGTGFTGATSVTIGGVVIPATGFVVNPGGTSITVTVPVGATPGAGSLVVTTPVGAANQPFTVIVPPVFSGLSPTSGPVVTTTITLTGTGFTGATGVTIGTVVIPATGFVVNPGGTTITLTVPAGLVPGTYSVVVTTPGGASGGRPFTVTMGTATRAAAAGLALYPNPAHRSFTLRLPALGREPSARLTLLNALGQVVQTRELSLGPAGTEAVVDVRGLAPGLYTVRVQAGRQAATRQVVVE